MFSHGRETGVFFTNALISLNVVILGYALRAVCITDLGYFVLQTGFFDGIEGYHGAFGR